MSLNDRAANALAKVQTALSKGDAKTAMDEVAKCRALAEKEPMMKLAGVTEERLAELVQQIETIPEAAKQVLKFAAFSPFSALGIPRLQAARTLNTVNKRHILKEYRKLAVKLHPDKCDHPTALHAMQALNQVYEKTVQAPKGPRATSGPKGKPGPKRPGARR